MEHKLTRCAICGSDKIVEKESFVEEDNVYHRYQCLSCMESFDSKRAEAEKQKTEQYLRNRAKNLAPQSVCENQARGENVFDKNKASVVLIKSAIGDNGLSMGSGFIVSKSGYVITNAHVVTNTENVSENLAFKLNECVLGLVVEKFNDDLEIVSVDKKRDLALLKYNSEMEYVPVSFANFDEVKTGERVFAMGNAKGDGLSITSGIVSDKLRKVNNQFFLMTDAPLNSGNSGGPLFNDKGECMACVSSMKKDANAMNYAIPINEVISFIRSVEADEEIDVLG